LASFMRALLVVGVDATIKTYFKRAPFYNAFIRSWRTSFLRTGTKYILLVSKT
jgi:hypothetical protein